MNAIRVATQCVVALGGLAALSWEVLWQLEASLSLGISALGTALTLAVTMGGMTAGSLAMGRLLERRPGLRPLRLYGLLECAIALAGLLMLPGFALVARIDAAVFAAWPAVSPLVHVAAIAVLLGPATLAMGATVPIFETLGRATGTSIARLYGINTAGAALGVLLISFALIPTLGMTRTCFVVSAINLGAFAATRWLDRVTEVPEPARRQRGSGPHAPRPLLPGAALLVFGTGFVTFALEVAWFRSLRAAFQSTSESFAIMLASVLIPLAVAARLTPVLRRRGVTPAGALVVAGAAILVTTPLVERIDQLVWMVTGPYALMLVVWFTLSLVILGPAVLSLGIALPWLLEEHADPGAAGRLYGANTLGAVAGSLASAWILLPNMGFSRSAWALGVLAAALAFLSPRQRSVWPGALTTAAALGIAIAFASSIGRERVQSPHQLEGQRVLAHDEGPDATIAVLEGADGVRRLLIDGFVATTEDRVRGSYMQWMGYLPMLLHPDPRDALVIGFGTGQTANAVRREQPTRLDVVDVDGTVFELAPLFRSNEGVLDGEHVNAIVMDGRAWLRRTDVRYDVITLEPMPPHFAGVNALYSRDFYELAAARLGPGGIVAQWLPLHLLPPYFAKATARTFRDSFPDSILWIDPKGQTGILLGRRERGAERLGAEWPGLARPGRRPLPDSRIRAAVVLDPGGMERYARDGAVITDDSQLLAYGMLRKLLVNFQHLVRKRENMRIIRHVARLQQEGDS